MEEEEEAEKRVKNEEMAASRGLQQIGQSEKLVEEAGGWWKGLASKGQ
jgi:hypothetical protein